MEDFHGPRKLSRDARTVICASTYREVERVPDIQSLTFADALMARLKRVSRDDNAVSHRPAPDHISLKDLSGYDTRRALSKYSARYKLGRKAGPRARACIVLGNKRIPRREVTPGVAPARELAKTSLMPLETDCESFESRYLPNVSEMFQLLDWRRNN